MPHLSFELNGRPGRLSVVYGPGADLEASGFDMFDPADFDPAVALGFPTLRAWVAEYAGTGYRTASAFLQYLDVERRPGGAGPTRELDALAEDRGALPFLAYGYPAAMFDAPAHNLRGSAWMRWRATTWFVTLPARWNDHEVRPVAGFRWGYEESTEDGVRLLPFESLQRQAWSADRDWLTGACPTLTIASG